MPCEVSDPVYMLRLFNDPAAAEKKLVSTFHHPVMGQMQMAGPYFDLSDTPGTASRPPARAGHAQPPRRDRLSPDEIDKLITSRSATEAPTPSIKGAVARSPTGTVPAAVFVWVDDRRNDPILN